MENTPAKRRSAQAGIDSESLLETYYSQLLKWGAVLTRGDAAMTQEIVHDLCLHFTLAKPDLSQVANLDGYLYTCLRNIYLSALARSSREAAQFVSTAEFDSAQFALGGISSEGLLRRQNDLRRICSFAMWRKESSKSASYLILLFFHGYCRREVAEIACLPIAAIYNKLKIAREELKSHLEDSGKLRIAVRDVPPEPELRLSPVSSVELFAELREAILQANPAECLAVDTLLIHYQPGNVKPISCTLLSHIVSCERCLNLIDRHFQRPTLEDREPPEDFGSRVDQNGMDTAAPDKSYRSMMRTVWRQRDRYYEHRPRTLSIAVNGKITAFHDVQGERSALSSRIEHTDNARFVEVLTEQQVRLALLPIGDRPPDGTHIHTQRVALSDDRWLELKLNFDGLGLESVVTYFDPALAAGMAEEEADEEASAVVALPNASPIAIADESASWSSLLTGIWQGLRAIHLRPAWAIGLVCAVALAGFLAYRSIRSPLNANEILSQSIRVETADLAGQTEHQIVQLEVETADGRVLDHATVDLWKEGGNDRYMRRLYNSQHRLIGAEWRTKDGQVGTYTSPGSANLSEADRALAQTASWKEDLSASSFQSLAGREIRIRVIGENYELTSTDGQAGQAYLISAALVLDHRLRPISESLMIRDGSAIHEIRLVQASYERQPSANVPASVFDPGDLDTHSVGDNGASSPQNRTRSGPIVADARLVRAQIAALYELSILGADTGEPIEVIRTPDGHIRVSGTVAEDARKERIRSGLNALSDHQLLEIRLASQREIRVPSPATPPKSIPAASVYNVAQTEAPVAVTLRRYFGSQGKTGQQIDYAIAEFSKAVLGHAQRALQHAYALDRLGASFTPSELKSVSLASEWEWAQMAAEHASGLRSELSALDEQLAPIAPDAVRLTQRDGTQIQIEDPADFARVASRLLRQTQNLNRSVGTAFASSTTSKTRPSRDALVGGILRSIPTQSAIEVSDFAAKLAHSEKAANARTQPDKRR